MNKKGQGLPLNTIIIAIIVIVVLVVIILIFTGQINIFQRTANACLARGGFCSADACAPGTELTAGNAYCADSTDNRPNCCRGLPGGSGGGSSDPRCPTPGTTWNPAVGDCT